MFSSNYGTLGTALLKLVALCLIVASANDTVLFSLEIITGGFAGIGFLLRWSIVAGVFFVTCHSLFDMDQMESSILFVIMIIVPWIVITFIGTAVFLWWL